jgi:hypothetical protein
VTSITSGSGWTSHPTFTSTAYTTATPITIAYQLLGTTFLNTSGSTPEGHGVSNAGGSATFKSYRVSKDGNPTLGNIMTIVIQFSQSVSCPTLVIGDVDNSLPTGVNGCSGTNAPTGPRWADVVSATGYTMPNAGGSTVPVVRIAGATGTGTNISPGVGAFGPWNAISCASIPQSSGVSDLTIQVGGTIRELRIDYVSNYADTVSTGNQHIALGDITFLY